MNCYFTIVIVMIIPDIFDNLIMPKNICQACSWGSTLNAAHKLLFHLQMGSSMIQLYAEICLSSGDLIVNNVFYSWRQSSTRERNSGVGVWLLNLATYLQSKIKVHDASRRNIVFNYAKVDWCMSSIEITLAEFR